MRRRKGWSSDSRPGSSRSDIFSVTPLSSYLDMFVRSVDDRRRFDPAGPLRPAYSLDRVSRRIIAKSSPVGRTRNDTLSSRVGFAVPERVAVCVRRKQRKEVIHALGKAGGGVSRRRRRNRWSDVDC